MISDMAPLVFAPQARRYLMLGGMCSYNQSMNASDPSENPLHRQGVANTPAPHKWNKLM